MQRQVCHPAGTLPRCTGCGAEMKHYEDLRAERVGGGHFLECSPCGHRTARRPSSADWVREAPPTAEAVAVSISRARDRAATRR